MKIAQIHLKQASVRELDFEALHDEISRAWQRKADRLQARRWKKLGRDFKSSSYIDYNVRNRGGILKSSH